MITDEQHLKTVAEHMGALEGWALAGIVMLALWIALMVGMVIWLVVGWLPGLIIGLLAGAYVALWAYNVYPVRFYAWWILEGYRMHLEPERQTQALLNGVLRMANEDLAFGQAWPEWVGRAVAEKTEQVTK